MKDILFWNFRDISTYNPKIKKGKLYRSASLAPFQNHPTFKNSIKDLNIKKIIDLRAPREVSQDSYSRTALELFRYVKIPFDPWNQSDEFKKNNNKGSNTEIAYLFFSLECKDPIKSVVEQLLDEKNSILIHCQSGKDRTGILVSLFHLLVGSSIDLVYEDYLASGMDTDIKHLDIFLSVVNESGGVKAYLQSCGLSNGLIRNLEEVLNHG